MKSFIFFILILTGLIFSSKKSNCQTRYKDNPQYYKNRLQKLAAESEPDSLFFGSMLFWNLFTDDSIKFSRHNYSIYKKQLEEKLLKYYHNYLQGKWKLTGTGNGFGYTISRKPSFINFSQDSVNFIENKSQHKVYKYTMIASQRMGLLFQTSIDLVFPDKKVITVMKYGKSGDIVISDSPDQTDGNERIYKKVSEL